MKRGWNYDARGADPASDGLHIAGLLHSLQVCFSQFLARPRKSRESACGLQILRLLLGHSLDKKQFVLEHGISMYFYVLQHLQLQPDVHQAAARAAGEGHASPGTVAQCCTVGVGV